MWVIAMCRTARWTSDREKMCSISSVISAVSYTHLGFGMVFVQCLALAHCLTLFYQAMSQCKALYKDHSETIMGNMDSIVFLGGDVYKRQILVCSFLFFVS